MIPIRILVPSLSAIAFVSCTPARPSQYDTPKNPYGATNPAVQGTTAAQPPSGPAANPVYDTPPAYEEKNPANAALKTNVPPIPATAEPSATQASAPAANGAAVLHTVVKGDSLSRISKQYKVPIASIKAANHMTNDTVILGRKLVIPPK